MEVLDILVYLKRRRRWRETLGLRGDMPYVVDLRNLDLSTSPLLLSTELEDLGEPRAIVLDPRDAEQLERGIMLADMLNVERIVATPPETVDDVAELYEVAVRYGVELNWLYGSGPMSSIEDVYTVAREVHPRAARVVYDPVRARSMRQIARDLVWLGGYIREIYVSNRSRGSGVRLLPMHPSGLINYAVVLEILNAIDWSGYLTIRVARDLLREVPVHASALMQLAETITNTGRLSRTARRLLRDAMGGIELPEL